MDIRLELLSFQNINLDAKTNYKILYECLPAPNTVEVESSARPSQTTSDRGRESMTCFRLNIGSLIECTNYTQLERRVHADVTLDEEGHPHLFYRPEAVSDSVDVQIHKIS